MKTIKNCEPAKKYWIIEQRFCKRDRWHLWTENSFFLSVSIFELKKHAVLKASQLRKHYGRGLFRVVRLIEG